MMNYLVGLAVLVSSADAFVVQPRLSSPLTAQFATRKVPVDVDRAQFCAEHFGNCSVPEMEQLKEELHSERLQTFVFGNTFHDNDTDMEAMEHRLLEDELEFQLGLLKEQMPDDKLFPDEIAELPHLHNDKEHHETVNTMLANENLLLAEEENLLEPLAICGVIVALMFLPQIMH